MMITFKQFISEAKKIVKLSAGELRKEAKAAGHKLFDSHRSGLIFDGDIEIMTAKEYGTSYDTFDYIFRPPKDVADDKVKKEHAIEGVIYVAGADGIKILTVSDVSVEIVGDLKVPQETGEGATWIVTDAGGYEYEIGPRRGQRPLSHDPEKALKQLREPGNRYGIRNVSSIKKP
jgi:hypothetical protein